MTDEKTCCHGEHHAHPAPSATAAGANYTCPMHPEIEQVGPGTCPKCGMALEPKMPVAMPEENPELVDFQRPVTHALRMAKLAECFKRGAIDLPAGIGPHTVREEVRPKIPCMRPA